MEGLARLSHELHHRSGIDSAYVTQSADGGRSWSTPMKTTVVAEASDLTPVRAAGRLPTSFVVHTWGDFSGRYGEGRPTLVQLIEVGTPGSLPTFGPPHLVYHGRCLWSDESYPSSVLLADGRVLTVYYDACTGYIGGSFLPLDALKAKPKP